MDPPPTDYIDRDGAALAYQIIGDGPLNLVVMLEVVQHLDLCWTDPHVHRNFERIAGLGRGVIFQRRGFGLSDPVPYVPTLEQQAEDVLAVMDAVGMDRALLVGTFSTCFPVALVAACAPARVSRLLLHVPWVGHLPLDGQPPDGWTENEAAGYRDAHRAAYEQWGSGQVASLWSPELGTPYNRRLMGLLERSSARPISAQAHAEWFARVDMTEVFKAIQVPTHVVRHDSDRIPAEVVRRAANLIPGAAYRSLPAVPTGASLGEGYAAIIDYAEDVVLGPDRRSESHRALGAVLFTDIVGSTELLVSLGDARYREVRDAHEREVHLAVETGGGRLVKVVGDGTLSVFDSPGRAIRCAEAIRDQASTLGLRIRAGVHFGEVDRAGPDISGLSVHIGARVSEAAGAGEILVSQTVHDVMAGSGLNFTARGPHHLKGVPGTWQLYAVSSYGRCDNTVEIGPSLQTFADRAAVATARRMPATMRALVRVANARQRRRARRNSVTPPA